MTSGAGPAPEADHDEVCVVVSPEAGRPGGDAGEAPGFGEGDDEDVDEGEAGAEDGVTPSTLPPFGRAVAAVGSSPLPCEGWPSVATPGGSAGIGASLRHLVADLNCG